MSVINQINKLKQQINNIDYVNYFKEEFTRIINCCINNFDINYVFRVLYFCFNVDFYILLISKEGYKKYYKLNNLNEEELQELIKLFINHFVEFYKNDINKVYKKYLSSDDEYFEQSRKAEYFNFISNEELIKNLNEKDDNYNKCSYLTKIFDNIRFTLYTSFINYEEFYAIYKVVVEGYDPDCDDEFYQRFTEIFEEYTNKYLECLGDKYKKYIKYLGSFYIDSSNGDYEQTFSYIRMDYYLYSELDGVHDFNKKFLESIPENYNCIKKDKYGEYSCHKRNIYIFYKLLNDIEIYEIEEVKKEKENEEKNQEKEEKK